jgi:hypothetical protein
MPQFFQLASNRHFFKPEVGRRSTDLRRAEFHRYGPVDAQMLRLQKVLENSRQFGKILWLARFPLMLKHEGARGQSKGVRSL